jgi:hypothetical protein
VNLELGLCNVTDCWNQDNTAMRINCLPYIIQLPQQNAAATTLSLSHAQMGETWTQA